MKLRSTSPANAAILNNKIGSLLSQNKITPRDIEELITPERELLEQTVTTTLPKLKGIERDNFLDKIYQIIPDSSKNNIWEHNHAVISTAISDLMRQQGMMPTKNAIAAATGLSRQTVAKHVAAYRSHPEFVAEAEQFKLLSHNVLASVFKHASNGNMQAARLYFEMVGAINKQRAGTVVNEQRNYIQINNTILSQENLKHLTAEQLNQIEKIITNKEYQLVP